MRWIRGFHLRSSQPQRPYVPPAVWHAHYHFNELVPLAMSGRRQAGLAVILILLFLFVILSRRETLFGTACSTTTESEQLKSLFIRRIVEQDFFQVIR